MNLRNVIGRIFFTVCVIAVGASFGFGQGIFNKIKDKVKSDTKTQTGSVAAKGAYTWARIEVRASWADKFEKKYETRVYYSNIIPYKTGDSKMVENLATYFEDGVAAPLKSRGIEIKFYDSDIKIYPFSYAYETTEEAEKEMTEKMEVDKSNKYAIYTFIWKYNAAASGEDMTQPKRIFSDKPGPALENTKTVTNNNAAEREAKQNAEKKDNELAQQQKQIWGYAVLKVRVRSALGKESTRVYVSEIAPVTREDYNAFYNTDERFIKPRIWEYFAATVVKAAKARGEEIEEPYDSSIMYAFSLDRDADLKPLFRPKSVLDEPRSREIGYAKQDAKPVYYFRWDTSGKNAAQDFQKEMNRGNSSNLPL